MRKRFKYLQLLITKPRYLKGETFTYRFSNLNEILYYGFKK